MSEARRPAAESYVYFIREGRRGLIKIGYSKRVHARVRGLSAQSGRAMRLLAAMPGGKPEEQELHRRFADARVLGEWFRPHPELLAEIKKVSSANPWPVADGGDRQVQFRCPTEVLEKLDTWLEDLNRGRRIPLNRSELIVGTLDWAADTRPDWEERPLSAAPPREYPTLASAPALRAAEPTGPAYGSGERFVEPDEAAAPQVPAAKQKRSRRGT